MIRNQWGCRAALGFIVLAVGSPGCRKRDQSATVAPVSGHATPATAPTARPAAALWVDGVSYRFPAATLVLSPQGGEMNATLCSDDPPEAITAGYRGNSFMIAMKLDVSSADDLDNYVWKYVADTTADVDGNTGVFLNGTVRQLQPAVLSVTFHKRGDDWIADLDGQFQSLDTRNPAAQRKSAGVTGRLYTRIVSQP